MQGCGSGLRLTGSGSDPAEETQILEKSPDPIIKKTQIRNPARGSLEHILYAVHRHQCVQAQDDTIWIRILSRDSTIMC